MGSRWLGHPHARPAAPWCTNPIEPGQRVRGDGIRIQARAQPRDLAGINAADDHTTALPIAYPGFVRRPAQLSTLLRVLIAHGIMGPHGAVEEMLGHFLQ